MSIGGGLGEEARYQREPLYKKTLEACVELTLWHASNVETLVSIHDVHTYLLVVSQPRSAYVYIPLNPNTVSGRFDVCRSNWPAAWVSREVTCTCQDFLDDTPRGCCTRGYTVVRAQSKLLLNRKTGRRNHGRASEHGGFGYIHCKISTNMYDP